MKLPDLQAFNKVYDKISIIQEADLRETTKATTIKNLYRLLAQNHVEGRYHDEHWEGPRKLEKVLSDYGVDYELETTRYIKHPDYATQLPNAKIFIYNVKITDQKQQEHIVPLRVNCSFVGRTGTMEDDVYELTYYFQV